MSLHTDLGCRNVEHVTSKPWKTVEKCIHLHTLEPLLNRFGTLEFPVAIQLLGSSGP